MMTKMMMKLIRLAGIVAVVGSQSSYAATYTGKTIHDLQIDGRACVFFTLDSVSVADAAVPGSPWFALPKGASNFAEMNAMLLSAKLAGKAVTVSTDGTASCSYATVTMVALGS